MWLGEAHRDLHHAHGLHFELSRHNRMGAEAVRRSEAFLNPLLASDRR